MRDALKYSILLHLFVISLLFLRVPHMANHVVKEKIITVGLISNADFTNLYNKPVKTKSDHEDASPKDLKPEFTPTKAETQMTQPQIKPQSPKPGMKPPTHSLKDVSNNHLQPQSTKNPQAKASVLANSTKAYDSSLPLTMSENDNIKTQIENKFNNTIVQDFKPGEIIIKLRLQMSKSGEVKQVIPLVSDSRYPMKYAQIFGVLTDNLVRAAHGASPLQNLPPEKYHGSRGWHEIELSFDAYSLMNS